MAVMRTVFTNVAPYYSGSMECHCCRRTLVTGNRYCRLLNTTDDYYYWCYRCARQFPRFDGR